MSDRTGRATVSSLHRDIRKSLGEHEVLVSFDNDDDAAGFDDWWLSEGERAYLAWKQGEVLP